MLAGEFMLENPVKSGVDNGCPVQNSITVIHSIITLRGVTDEIMMQSFNGPSITAFESLFPKEKSIENDFTKKKRYPNGNIVLFF